MSGPQIVCSKCQAAASGGLICAACGGGLVKLCPKCRFQNSVQKNFCDGCGTPMGGLPTPLPGESGIPHTVIRRGPAPSKEPPVSALPPAGRSAQSFEAPPPTPAAPPPPAAGAKPAAAPPSRRSFDLLPRGVGYFISSVLAIIVLLAVGAAGTLGFLHWRQTQRPENQVLRLSHRYLALLAENNYAAAYEMLSSPAKAACSLDEFRLLRDTTPWNWSNARVSRVEQDAIFVSYDLAVEGRAPSVDHILFVREGKSWVRPYNWSLLKKVEDAFDRKDTDLALIHAQAAVHINPRDPMARGYLCEAVYFRRIPEQTERECAVALELLKTYPSKLDPKSIYHLHAILGDTYKNSLRRFDKAVEQYDLMLAFPKLSREDQCDLLLARADARAAMGRAAEAVADLELGAQACDKPDDIRFIQAKRAELER